MARGEGLKFLLYIKSSMLKMRGQCHGEHLEEEIESTE